MKDENRKQLEFTFMDETKNPTLMDRRPDETEKEYLDRRFLIVPLGNLDGRKVETQNDK